MPVHSRVATIMVPAAMRIAVPISEILAVKERRLDVFLPLFHQAVILSMISMTTGKPIPPMMKDRDRGIMIHMSET